MKKIVLSALVIAASGAYVWSQGGTTTDPLLADAGIQTGSIQPQTLTSAGAMNVAPREVPFVTPETAAPAAPAPTPTFAAQAPAAGQPLPPAATDPSGFAPAASDTQPPVDAAPTPSGPGRGCRGSVAGSTGRSGAGAG